MAGQKPTNGSTKRQALSFSFPPSGPDVTEPNFSLLDNLQPKSQVNVVVRVVSSKARFRDSAVGQDLTVTGVVEDSSYRMRYIAYHNLQDFRIGSLLEIRDAYVHQNQDGQLILAANNLSRVENRGESVSGYVWQPKIGRFKRPTGSLSLDVSGLLSDILPNSGLVRRCSSCHVVALGPQGEICRRCGSREFFTRLRIVTRLEDETGSIETIFPQGPACDLLGVTEGQLLYEIEIVRSWRTGSSNSAGHRAMPKRPGIHVEDLLNGLIGSPVRVRGQIVRVAGQLRLIVTKTDGGGT